ncbi:UbiA prenyltransferase [Mycena indigotica]|uniref:UbiA prenyltransferase n=1 Tax=Mycena indigotica TaxID=2126181 RepID=A0A8H6SQV9_9AGAR|nr:UbiA prenyltransferase [Mycena indigotica]KAF7303831.1 UbiA prenyltransferase [Mycena indigotica]
MSSIKDANTIASPLGLATTPDFDNLLGLPYLADVIDHEIRVFWAFTKRDWSASVIPGMMYTIAALRSLDSSPSPHFIARALGRSLIYFILYIYNFDIANQINGVAEDRINKPDRPLASGLASMKGAYIRWYATTVLHLVLGAMWGVLPWTALWVFITVYTSFYGGDKHWTTKNLLFMSTGSLCLLQAAWGLAAPISGHQTRWGVLLSSVFGLVASIQDMRDVEGDKVAGRRTLPIVLGTHFRWIMTLLVCIAPVICWQAGFLHYSQRYCGAVLTMAMFYMALRVMTGKSSRYDHKTYMILTYIYCGCVAVPMLVP